MVLRSSDNICGPQRKECPGTHRQGCQVLLSLLESSTWDNFCALQRRHCYSLWSGSLWHHSSECPLVKSTEEKIRSGKKQWQAYCASQTGIPSSFLSQCGLWKTSSPELAITLQQVLVACCAGVIAVPLPAPGPAAPGSGSALYLPLLKIMQI